MSRGEKLQNGEKFLLERIFQKEENSWRYITPTCGALNTHQNFFYIQNVVLSLDDQEINTHKIQYS
eukprot:TRINITY_DN1995_c0_g1_i1.p2 TRINITY_DN1995_c0_g1~~TRINITY_DN1995_c0_g1_i1.p2  ORF type:complete len:66 (+),score=9.69 TRINITY_DN1995_c0_g1_i1:155-352(+)